MADTQQQHRVARRLALGIRRFNPRVLSLVVSVALLSGLLVTVAESAQAQTTYSETPGYSSNPGGVINTWTNYTNAGGTAGPTINPYTTVQILCYVYGFKVQDGNTYWYQIASSPWNNQFYASADAFYNNGSTSGSLHGTPWVDPAVPSCASIAGGVTETAGGAAQTWTNYSNAGGTQGPTIGGGSSVQIACALTGFKVQDGNTWWYQIASSPWNHAYYVSADAFYNNGATSGSLAGTPWVDPAVPPCSSGGAGGGGGGGSGITEQEGHYGVNTFANFQNASGTGPSIGAGASVQVACKVYAPQIASVNPDGYWYQIASSPWDNAYYAPANTFLNGDPWDGPYSHNTDYSVPDCGNAPRSGAPVVTLAQGPAKYPGYEYAISVAGFAANSTVYGVCYDSVSPGGWEHFPIYTDGSGAGSTQDACISGDGPDHWVVVSGTYASNHVTWGAGSGGGTGYISSPAAGNQGSTPPRSQNSTTCSSPRPVNCATGDFWHTFSDFSVPGRGVPLDFTHTYSSSAASIDGPLGYGWTDSYNMSLTTDSSGNVSVNEEDGATVTFASNGSGGFTAPSRVLAALSANGDGTYIFTRTRTGVQYVFSTYGQLLREVDRNGYTTTLGYTGNLLTSITDPSGRALTLTYSGSQVSQITDPLGRTISFAYDATGNLISETNPLGGVWNFTYDSNHLLLSMSEPALGAGWPANSNTTSGGTTTNVYDSSDRVVSQTDPAGLTTTWSYSGDSSSATGGTTTMTDPNGDQTLYSYQNLELQSVTHAAGTSLAATTSYTYDPNTLAITSVTDPNGHVTSYTYDASGNQLTKTDALGRVTTSTYNSFNEPLTVTDPTGAETTYSYDGAGNLLSTTNALGGTTTLSYGDSSHPGDATTSTDPDGHVSTMAYDSYGNLAAKSTSPASGVTNTTTYLYDADSEKVCSTRPNETAAGVTCQAANVVPAGADGWVYDANGDLTQVIDPLGNVTINWYDGEGNKTATIDPERQTTDYLYDADNRLVETNQPNGSYSTTSYDGDGNVLVSTDGNGNKTTNTYNALNQLTATVTAKDEQTSYAYDLVGNRTSQTDNDGIVSTYTYDAANQLTGSSYSNGSPNDSYSYDKDGRRVSMTDGTGTTSYSYDALGRLTGSVNGAGQAVSYSLDADGNVLSLGYPGGKTVTKTYDGAGQLSTVTDWLGHTTSFSYDGDGNVIKQVVGSTPAVTDSYTYEAADHLTAINDVNAAGTSLQGFNYQRNADSLVTSATSTNGTTSSYSYDSNNQLIGDPQGSDSYDAAGNITTLATNTKLSYNTDEEITSTVKGKATTTMVVNDLGDRYTTTAKGGAQTSYFWDQNGNMDSAQNASTFEQYSYNADGLRMSKKVGNISTNQYTTIDSFAWDTTPSVPLLLSDGTTSYIYGPTGLPLESINKNTVKFFHHDQLGSTTMLTSAKGTVLNKFTYSSYGKLLTGSATVTPLLFAGQYRDSETGLYYLRARYYDPTTAQFMSLDPAVAQTHAPYSYAGGDPVNGVDPSGQFAIGGLNLQPPYGLGPPSNQPDVTGQGILWGILSGICAAFGEGLLCGIGPNLPLLPGSSGAQTQADIFVPYGDTGLLESLVGAYQLESPLPLILCS